MTTRRHVTVPMLALAFALLFAPVATAEVRLPSVISDNMVLQQGMAVPVWGWADAGEKVAVSFAGKGAETTANEEGEWMVRLGPFAASSEPRELVVAGSGGTRLTVRNVLVGEVWIGSGQSNMEFPLEPTINGEEFIRNANYPEVRLFYVPRRTAVAPLEDIEASWKPCSPQTVGLFSAVLYHFGRNLHEELGTPIGLIDTSRGATRAEPWTPPEGFASVPELKEDLEWLNRANARYEKAKAAALDKMAAWLRTARQAAEEGRRIPEPPEWPRRERRHRRDPWQDPATLYNAMVHPVIPYAIRGVIWYQGESNLGDGMFYYYRFKGLVQGWRMLWGQGDFPFYFVELAPYDYSKHWRADPTALPALWDAQLRCLSIPKTGMAVTVDIGDADDIHPRNKHEVGRRLALWALAKTYGRDDIVYSGPLYKSYAVEDSSIRVSFTHTGSGLTTRDGGPIRGLTIAGEDRVFVPAEGRVEGDTIVVSSPKVTKPVAVRYAWQEVPTANLVNKEGLPASPFRTDKW